MVAKKPTRLRAPRDDGNSRAGDATTQRLYMYMFDILHFKLYEPDLLSSNGRQTQMTQQSTRWRWTWIETNMKTLWTHVFFLHWLSRNRNFYSCLCANLSNCKPLVRPIVCTCKSKYFACIRPYNGMKRHQYINIYTRSSDQCLMLSMLDLTDRKVFNTYRW